jgi:hypothetical protein
MDQTLVFDMWNLDKKRIHTTPIENVFVNTREIWYTKMGINI